MLSAGLLGKVQTNSGEMGRPDKNGSPQERLHAMGLPEDDVSHGSEDNSDSFSYCSSGSEEYPVSDNPEVLRIARQQEQEKARHISAALVRKVLAQQQQQRSGRKHEKDRRRGDRPRVLQRHRLRRTTSTGSGKVPNETAFGRITDTQNQCAEPFPRTPRILGAERVEISGCSNRSEIVFRKSRRTQRTTKLSRSDRRRKPSSQICEQRDEHTEALRNLKCSVDNESS